jgi:thiol-disulfide isomerase/thioredoxin
MGRLFLALLFTISVSIEFHAQESSDPVAQALAQGDLYQSKHKYDLALAAYHKADKLSHHSSAPCYLKIASVERKLGDFSAALDDAKRAVKAASENRSLAIQAHLLRATLLTQVAGKSTDKKLKEAEDEIRQALAMDSGHPLARFDLGVILLKQGHDPEGLAELNTFLNSAGADSVIVAEARRFLANPIRAREPFAPDFSFTTHENQNVSNASLRGKVVLIDFWGTWCPPCRESIPILRNLNKKYAGKPFQLIGVSSDDDEDVWKTFIAEQHMDWAEYIDLPGNVLQAFKVESFPTYIVLDKDGVIRFRQSGLDQSTGADLEDAINKALKRESDPRLAAAAVAEPQPPATSTVSPKEVYSSASKREENPADAPPQNGIEGGVISGNTYKNNALGMTYQFPAGWVAAKAEVLRAVNERTTASLKAALLQQRPDLANSSNVMIPQLVFYASRHGGDAQRIDVPSIRMTAVPSRLDSIKLDAFQQMAQNMTVASSMKMIANPSEILVQKHQFLRVDFERGVGATHVYQSLVQTIAGDYLLSIEIFAYSSDELQQVAASIQSMSIADDDP